MLFCCADNHTDSQTQKTAPAAASGNEVVAKIDGTPITQADIMGKHKADFDSVDREYQQKRHQLLENYTNQTINDQLLDKEAAARGVSRDQVLGSLVVPPVTDADVDSFYEKNQAQIGRPKEQIVDQIKAYLKQQNNARVQDVFFKELRAKYKVDMVLEPLRIDVAATGPVRGAADAPVTIVEFSDFQCPFCSRLVPTLEQVMTKYGNQVKLVFRQYPLTIHPFAEKAAEASLCANDQGLFWKMHDAMFHDQQGLAVDGLKAKAVSIGANADKFNQCLDSGQYAQAVRSDIDAGNSAGVSGTPALFVDGRFINGAVPLEDITKIIDDELQRKSSKK